MCMLPTLVVQDEVEPELPSNWKKFICLKDNKPIKKLVKYEDPEVTRHHALPVPLRATQDAVRVAQPLLNLIAAGKVIIVFTT